MHKTIDPIIIAVALIASPLLVITWTVVSMAVWG